MRTVGIVVVMLLAVALGGCLPQQKDVDLTQAQVDEIVNLVVTEVQPIKPELAEKINTMWQKYSTQFDGAQDKYGPFIAELDRILGTQNGGLEELIKKMQGADAASAPWNKYAAQIESILGLAALAAALFAKKKTTEAKTNKAEAENNAKKYAAHKFVVESEIFKEPDLKGGFAKKIYERIGEERARLGVTV